MPVQHDLRQSNNTPPCSRPRKRKPESLPVILEPLLVWSGPVFLCSHCLLCVQHAQRWSVEDTKTQNEVKDDLCLLCAGHSWLPLSILGGTLWGKDPNTHFQFSCSDVSDSVWPYRLQHARLPCPSLIPGACSNSWPSSQWWHPTISFSGRPLLLLPSILLSIRVFSNESFLCIRWPKNWSFSISPSDEYSRLISFRIDWFDLLAIQQTLKSLLQHLTSDQMEARSLAHNLIVGDRGTENKLRPQPIWFQAYVPED